jgi:hypothetical protein
MTIDARDNPYKGTEISDEECEVLNRQQIYAALEKERAYQVGKWGNDADDTKNEPNDWAAFIAHHSTRWFNGGFAPYDKATVDAFRVQMLKVATLAVAAIESLDRQRGDTIDSKAFYEK